MISQPDLSNRLATDSKGLDQLRQSAKQNSPDAVKATAQQFESMFLNMVMKSMRDASGQEGGVFDNQQSKMFTGMLDQQLSQSMAKRGVGLADVLARQLAPAGKLATDETLKGAAAGAAAKGGLHNSFAANALAASGAAAKAGAALSDAAAAVDSGSRLAGGTLLAGLEPGAQTARAKRLADYGLAAHELNGGSGLSGINGMHSDFNSLGANEADEVAALLSAGQRAMSRMPEQLPPADLSQVKPLNLDDVKSSVGIKTGSGIDTVGKPGQPAHVRNFQAKLAASADEASRTTGIPAKFLLGQAALESGWGRREITGADGKPSHNLFGIKATPGWKGKVVEAVTTEYTNGVPHARREKFRAYDSYADAFRDYGKLLSKNPRYENVIANAQDASSFARGLQRAGYATDPNYAVKLTRIINNSLS